MKKLFYFIFILLIVNIYSYTYADNYASIKNIEEVNVSGLTKIILYLDKIPDYDIFRDNKNATISLKGCLVPTDSFQTKSFTLGQANENDVIIQTAAQAHKPLNVYADINPLRLIIEVKNYFYERNYQLLIKGVEWKNLLKCDVYGSLHLNCLEISKESKIKLMVKSVNNSNTGRQKLTDLIKGTNVLSAINGGFFGSNGEAIGYMRVNSKEYGFPFRNRAILGINGRNCYMARVPFSGKVKIKGKKTFKISGFNRKRNPGEVIIYDSSYGKTTKTPTDKPGAEFVVMDNKIVEVYNGDAIIPNLGFVISIDGKSGEDTAEKISVKEDIVEILADFPPQFKNIESAITGGPLLISNGSIVLNLAKEGFNSSYNNPAPRTAIGLTKDKIIFFTVDGRQSKSKGFSLKELATYLYNIGCYNAMNLDGGGSTTMIVKDRIVNYPSDGQERTINNGIILSENKK